MPIFIQLNDICKTYTLGDGSQTVYALNHVSLSINKGEFVAIVGHSGSGKSTLMNILGCLDEPSSGQVFLSEAMLEDPQKPDTTETTQTYKTEESQKQILVSNITDKQLSRLRNRQIGFVFQSFNLIPSLTALENVELPLLYRGLAARPRRELSVQALKLVGLADRMNHFPSQMSGGQQQRVAIARAVAANPPMILADEPTGNLDQASAAEILRIFRRLHKEGRTIILITHDMQIAQESQRIVCIENGKITDDCKTKSEMCQDQIT